MGDWVDSAKAIFGPPAKEPAHEMLINQNFAEFVLTAGDFEDWVTEGYKKNEVVNRCLNMIMNTVCEAPIHVFDEEGKILDNHPTEMLLKHINPHETQKQFFKRLLLYMYLGDIGFIEKVFTRGGKVTELGLLRPDKVRVNANERIGVQSFEYEPNGAGKTFTLDPRAVMMMQFIDPVNRLKGFSPLKALAMRIDKDNEHTQHIMSVLQNGGVPGSILKVSDFLDREQAVDLARSFDQKTQGTKKGSTMVLHGGVEYESFGSTFRDLEAKELTKVDEAKILSGLGIPLPVFGGVSGTDASTFDNMRTAFKIFWRQTIIPLQSMIEDYLNGDLDLLPMQDRMKGYKIAFDRSNVEALKEDQDLLSMRAREDYKAGIITLNEARKAGGFEPLTDGDSLFSPFGNFDMEMDEEELNQEEMKAIEDALLEAHEGKTIALAEVEKGLLQAKEGKIKPVPEEVFEEVEEHTAADFSDEQKNIQEIERKLKDYEIATKRMKIADRAAFSMFKLARKHLTRHISDVQAIIGSKDSDPKELITKQAEQTEIEQQLKQLAQSWTIQLQADSVDVMGKLVSESAEQASAQVGGQFSIEDETVQSAIKAQQFKFAKGISGTSEKQIGKVISAAFDEGKSLKDLRKDIQKLGDQFNQTRAQNIARTETVRAANQGARLGYKQAGVTKLRYTAVLDGDTSEICEHLNGKIVGIDEKFFDETSFTQSNGRPLDLSYDEGVPEPPAHPNCRSTIVPEFDDGF